MVSLSAPHKFTFTGYPSSLWGNRLLKTGSLLSACSGVQTAVALSLICLVSALGTDNIVYSLAAGMEVCFQVSVVKEGRKWSSVYCSGWFPVLGFCTLSCYLFRFLRNFNCFLVNSSCNCIIPVALKQCFMYEILICATKCKRIH